MAWTATKTGVTKEPGIVYVDVEYTDGTSPFTETYRSLGPPDTEWIEKTVDSRLTQLNGADATTIPTGAVSAPTPEATAWLEMRDVLKKLAIMEHMINLEVVPLANAKVQSELQKIKDNLITYWDRI